MLKAVKESGKINQVEAQSEVSITNTLCLFLIGGFLMRCIWLKQEFRIQFTNWTRNGTVFWGIHLYAVFLSCRGGAVNTQADKCCRVGGRGENCFQNTPLTSRVRPEQRRPACPLLVCGSFNRPDTRVMTQIS